MNCYISRESAVNHNETIANSMRLISKYIRIMRAKKAEYSVFEIWRRLEFLSARRKLHYYIALNL